MCKLICHNTIMQVYGAWVRMYYVLCPKAYGTFGGRFWSPAGSWQATRSARICETQFCTAICCLLLDHNAWMVLPVYKPKYFKYFIHLMYFLCTDRPCYEPEYWLCLGYRKFFKTRRPSYGDLGLSYFHNCICFMGKTTALYWIRVKTATDCSYMLLIYTNSVSGVLC